MGDEAMVRTQIYLTAEEQQALRRIAAAAGLWREREDLPDFTALRREANRIPYSRI